MSAIFQCDASDRRAVKLPNGNVVETTCLVVGEFDIVAVSLFGFRGKWEFAFALNQELPRTPSKKYADADKPFLIKSGIGISWPIREPFTHDLLSLFQRLAGSGSKTKRAGVYATS